MKHDIILKQNYYVGQISYVFEEESWDALSINQSINQILFV